MENIPIIKKLDKKYLRLIDKDGMITNLKEFNKNGEVLVFEGKGFETSKQLYMFIENSKKTDGNFKVIETKLREGTSKLSTGQDVIRKHVQNGNQKFEVRSDNKVLGLNRGQTIQVDEYVVKYKYKQ